ncbi:MAG: FHA domain-containing protein [Deltaproteobacteria bacterium]|nr:FHA domain-containing protein [Deltaproteobacteria bacterium]
MARSFLKIVHGARQGLNVPLSPREPLVIGRRQGELLLDDPLVSGRHCQVAARGAEWVLTDLGSTNGTMVDGRLVRELVLRPGSEIQLGSTKLILFVGAPEEQATAEEKVPESNPAAGADLAWLLEEELVEIAGSGERTRSPADVIGQELRLPPGLNALVEVVAGQDTGKVFRFTRGNVNIGRRNGEVPLSDGEVSRRHSVVEVFGRDMIFLRDLGSTNGTYHNGRRVLVGRLRSGDTIGIGKTVLKLQVTR